MNNGRSLAVVDSGSGTAPSSSSSAGPRGALQAGGSSASGSTSSASIQPSRSYALFREKLRHPSAQPVVTKLLEFVREFPSGLPRSDAARRVHRFVTRMQEWMLSETDAFSAEADEDGKTSTIEGLEKFLLGRLQEKLFAAADSAETAEDAKLHRHISGLRWIEFRHLGVPPVDPALLSLAVKELQRMEKYKAPRDKLVCILNACHVISNVLSQTRAESGVRLRPLSADDFLPLLIYAVVMANPPRLHSNVEFVAAFRHPSRLVAEDAYFLTALQSAVAFVRDAGPKALDVSPEEFDRLYAASLREQAAVDGQAETASSKPSGVHPGLPAALPASVSAKAAELSAAARRRLSQRVAALPLRFEAVQSAQQLRVQDVETLLEEYREMAQILHDVAEGTLGQ